MNNKIPTYEDIKPYIENRLVSMQRHPENRDYAIFNYTKDCQYKRTWDWVTTQCRGLILDLKTGEVIARPFPKFFNYGEHIGQGLPLPVGVPVITHKMDGSLGILYRMNDQLWIATRGSFASDQAVWATKWLRENYADISFSPSFTYLFEIIYPENKIVVNYGEFEGLVLLEMINKETGVSEPIYIVSNEAPKMKLVTQVPPRALHELAALDIPNQEGFVVRYPSGVRLKIKFAEYVRLHKIITNINDRDIWKSVLGHDVLYQLGYRDEHANPLSFAEILDRVPDEFFTWVEKVKKGLEDDFATMWDAAEKVAIEAKKLPTRKEQAAFINGFKFATTAFAVMDGREMQAKKIIWKELEPHGKSTFVIDIDQ